MLYHEALGQHISPHATIHWNVMESWGEILGKAYEALSKYPLCTRCLGRLFAGLGRGLGNEERGRAVKTLLAMELHSRALRDPDKLREALAILSRSSGEPFSGLYRHLYGEEPPAAMPCYVCGGRLGEIVGEWSRRVSEILRGLGARSFLLGVRPPRAFSASEEEVARSLSIPYWESVRSELRREIGKEASRLSRVKPDLEDPGVVLVIDIERSSVEASLPSLEISAKVVKLARGAGLRRRSEAGSLEEAILRDLGGSAKEVRIHSPIRDTSRYRILGSGCEVLIELRSPDPRRRDLAEISKILATGGKLYRAIVTGRGSLRTLAEASKRMKRILYRVYAVSEDPVPESWTGEARAFRAEQRTPARLLRISGERVRIGDVELIRLLRISGRAFEILVAADPQLYIEELITGDMGRTRPSISEVLGIPLTPLEIDILGTLA